MSELQYSFSWHKPTNRWACRRTIALLDDTKKQLITYGKTKLEASKKMDEKIVAAKQYGFLQKGNLTVESYLLYHLNHKDGIKDGIRAKQIGCAKKHILPRIGHLKLTKVKEQTIQQLVDALYKDGVKERTVQIARNILSPALRQAASQNLMYPVDMRNIKLKTYIPKEKKIWTQEESDIFLQAAKGDEYYILFLLCLRYGLRRGEAIGLHWEDIDFENDLIQLVRQYTDIGHGFGITSLKTRNSKRNLPLTPDIKAELLKLRVNAPTTGPVIRTPDNDYIKPNSFRWHLKKLIKQCNLPEVDIHSMRHTTATMLKNSGTPDVDIQHILGHASVRTTINCYQHTDMDAKRRALLSLVHA